jgi:hypothetical protein
MKAQELILLKDHIKERPVKITYTSGHEQIFYLTRVEDRRAELKNDKAVVAISDTDFEVWAIQIKKIEFINDDHKAKSIRTGRPEERLNCEICKALTWHNQDQEDASVYTCQICKGNPSPAGIAGNHKNPYNE